MVSVEAIVYMLLNLFCFIYMERNELIFFHVLSLYDPSVYRITCFFFFQAEDGIRDLYVTGVQTCALPICIDMAIFGEPAREMLAVRPHHNNEIAACEAALDAGRPGREQAAAFIKCLRRALVDMDRTLGGESAAQPRLARRRALLAEEQRAAPRRRE